MEVEERNCSMASNSCDLTLYVGYILRSLRSSLDAVESGQVFAESLGEQLRDWSAGWTTPPSCSERPLDGGTQRARPDLVRSGR